MCRICSGSVFCAFEYCWTEENGLECITCEGRFCTSHFDVSMQLCFHCGFHAILDQRLKRVRVFMAGQEKSDKKELAEIIMQSTGDLAQVVDGTLFQRIVASEIFAEMENLRLLYEISKNKEKANDNDDEFYFKRSDVLCKLLVKILDVVGISFAKCKFWHRAYDLEDIFDSQDSANHALLCGHHPLLPLKSAETILAHIRSLIVRYREGEPCSADVSKRLSHSFPPVLANLISTY